MQTTGGSRTEINFAKRIVIKVGTSTITYENGRMNHGNIDRLCRAIADLMNSGKEVVLVTSGAIGVGIGCLKLPERPTSMRDKQAVAAVGQCELMNSYTRSFSEYSYVCGQILLTKDDLLDNLTKANISNTIEALLEKRIIPVVNENDTVATYEIEIGDNDTLSAIVTALTDADLLILLSDIDGLYTDNPRSNPDAKFISYVPELTDEIKNMGKDDTGSSVGTGGMSTKLTAAEIATLSGADMIIANSSDIRIIHRIMDSRDIGTMFASNKNEEFSLKDYVEGLHK